MIIIGHRGARGLAPENTVESIQAALEIGVAMIELDVREHNGALILSHDDPLKTKEYTTLKAAFSAVNGSVPLNLEIKEHEVLPLLASEVSDYNGKILFSSKKYHVLHDLKKILPTADVAVIEKWSGTRAVAEASLLHTKRLHFYHQWLWSNFVKSLKHQGYEVYAYTVNRRDRAEELASWGIDGIFTDFPNLFIK